MYLKKAFSDRYDGWITR